MSSEWLFHNIAYELHIKRKSTADADIEYTGDCRPYVYIPTKVLEILGVNNYEQEKSLYTSDYIGCFGSCCIILCIHSAYCKRGNASR